MKKFLFFLPFLFNTHSYAESIDDAKNYFYAGANLLVANTTEAEVMNVSFSASNDLGYGIFAGYNFAIKPMFDLGIELEYQNIKKAELIDITDINDVFNMDLEGDIFYINLRPRFTDHFLYSELILGAGLFRGELNVMDGVNSSLLDSDSDMSYQLGFELGYHINQFDIGVGYRYRMGDLDEFSLNIQGVTLGFKYRF